MLTPSLKLSAWALFVVLALMFQDTGYRGPSSAAGSDRVTQIVSLLTLIAFTVKSWLDSRERKKIADAATARTQTIATEQVKKIDDLGAAQGKTLEEIKSNTDGQLSAALTKISNLEKTNAQLAAGMGDVAAMLAAGQKRPEPKRRKRAR